jgi:hypothetical protein
MLKPILVATFVAVVILSECIFAWLLIPSSADLETWAKAKAGDPAAAAEKHDVPAAKESSAEHGAKDSHGAHGAKKEPDKAGAHGHAAPAAGGDAHSAAAGHGAAHGEGHEHEVDLGKFNLMIHQPAADVTLRINFHLIGIVAEKDHHEFTELLAKNQHRLRDHVLSEIRNSETSDLTDPGLGLIKRRILATSNELLGTPILHTIVFSDFSFVEQ